MIETLLADAAKKNNIQLNILQQNQLINYLHLLKKWNKIFNLTAITDPKEMVYLHLIDSLLIAPFLNGQRLLDVGTGAGLPGIPLAILIPEKHWTLLDKNNKKTRFLIHVVAELNLKNVEIVHAAVEDFHSPCFDSIVARALTSISNFVVNARHLLCDNGVFIAMKGKLPETELDEVPKGFFVEKITRIGIKGMNVERHIVSLRLNRG